MSSRTIGEAVPLEEAPAARLSADGRQSVIQDRLGDGRYRLRSLDMATGKVLHERVISVMELHVPVPGPDGRHVQFLTPDKVQSLLDLDTGEVVVAEPATDSPGLTHFSSDGTLLVTGGASGLHVRDVARGTSRSLPGSNGGVGQIEVARNTAWVAATVGDTIRVWNRDGELVRTFRWGDHTLRLYSNGAGTRLLTVDSDGQAALWDIATGEKVASLPKNALSSSIFVSVDGSTLATPFRDAIVLYDMTSLSETSVVTPEIGTAGRDLSLGPDGRLLLTSGRGGARLWDTARNVQIGLPINASVRGSPRTAARS